MATLLIDEDGSQVLVPDAVYDGMVRDGLLEEIGDGECIITDKGYKKLAEYDEHYFGKSERSE